MNRRYARLPALVALFVVLSAASCPPDRTALNSLQAIRTTAEHAVAVFKAGRLQTPPLFTDAQELQAKDLYSKYLSADKIAAEALLTAKSTDDISALITNATKTATDLANFVASLKGP